MVANTRFMFAGSLLDLLVLRTKEHILQHMKKSRITRRLRRQQSYKKGKNVSYNE
jgi:hypothetical protein